MFKLNINITEQDYLDFNIFWTTRSHYGKKQITNIRAVIAGFIAMYIVIMLFIDGLALETFLNTLPLIILFALIYIFLVKLFAGAIKSSVKSLKKKGKMGYSPTSVMEFLEDVFIETTPENKTEQKYSSVERISIVDNKTIYIHVNNVMAYIIPLSCFESLEQYESFLNFIKTKCANIDVY